jgi:RNA polymerase sigma-70 factor (ECF subfamily)
MLSEIDIINGCKKNNKSAQIALYTKYSPILRNICYRYASDKEEAEDILHDGFIKILSNIGKFDGKGSFEGWLKKVTVNNAITHYHKKSKEKNLVRIDVSSIQITDEEEDESNEVDLRNTIINSELSKEELITVINELPYGFRMVFNLYVFENFSHKEIGDKLNISMNTSKSQLSRARKLLQKLLYQYCSEKKLKNE